MKRDELQRILDILPEDFTFKAVYDRAELSAAEDESQIKSQLESQEEREIISEFAVS